MLFHPTPPHLRTGQQRDAWHHRGSPSISSGARPAAEPALRPASLSTGTAPPSSAAAHSNGGVGDWDRADRAADRDRDRAAHGAWSHFHTSNRSGRAGGRESASGHIGSVEADRFHTLGSPFKHGSSSRHGLQRSVSDSGGAASSADAVHSGFGSGAHQQQRDRHHPGSHSSRQGLGGAGGSAQHAYPSDDKLGWRDSNRGQQQAAAGGRGGSKVCV